jgi:nicotinate-nucleotide--dimethylbenzimidazole phosphoribosyltransferase
MDEIAMTEQLRRPSELLEHTVKAITPCDQRFYAEAARYQQQLTMPPGSLGRLLDLGRQLSAIQRRVPPQLRQTAVVVMAADHGVAEESVSAYPQEVTGQMVANFLAGGAAINVLADRAGARVFIVDMGVRHLPRQLAVHPQLLHRSIRPGTCNFLEGPAMSAEDACTALGVGIDLATMFADQGIDAVGLGEMGIGNTTAASALTAALTGCPAERVVGRGTGIDDRRLQHKVRVVERALGLHKPSTLGPLEAAAALGGLEIVGLAGLALGAARSRMAVVLDGFISSTAGLLAARLCPQVRDYLLAAHQSVEPGHRVVLDALGLIPLLDLQLRLGEGTGSVLALHLLGSAADIMQHMATFESAGVGRAEGPNRRGPEVGESKSP